jgi:hypothetical protein
MTDVAALVAALMGRPVEASERLDVDLRLDSLDLAALAVRLPGLETYLAGLDLDELLDLTVGDLTAWAAR